MKLACSPTEPLMLSIKWAPKTTVVIEVDTDTLNATDFIELLVRPLMLGLGYPESVVSSVLGGEDDDSMSKTGLAISDLER